jgi:hypothetical protein
MWKQQWIHFNLPKIGQSITPTPSAPEGAAPIKNASQPRCHTDLPLNA